MVDNLNNFGIHPERIRALNRQKVQNGSYVLYWMQQSQRTLDNHALAFSILKANELDLPPLVFFGLTADYPSANLRHYTFMLQGIDELRRSFAKMGVRFILAEMSPQSGAIELSKNAAITVVDAGYTRVQKKWRRELAQKAPCPVLEVDTNHVVPIGIASDKDEYGAYTIRRKIQQRIPDFLDVVSMPRANETGKALKIEIETLDGSSDDIQKHIKIDRSVPAVKAFRGGTSKALARLNEFLKTGLHIYDEKSNDPNSGAVSTLSPYLHFGQISPVTVALKVIDAGGPGSDEFLEQLIVRRELAANFVYYNPNYDKYKGLPQWALDTLQEHQYDERDYIYSRDEFENAQTHDPYWNAAQKEMLTTGYMHGYMRMYWSKKILEWSKTPEQAFNTALYLNDKYELDGRDPNGFTGIAWCFGKHDRPWKERAVFGKIRYMNDKGLRRKFDADAYVEKVEKIYREYLAESEE